MGTTIRKVYYLNPEDVKHASKLNEPLDKVKRKGGYFVKWTKFTRQENHVGGASIYTEIEMAVIADASNGQTYVVKSGDFEVDLLDFFKVNKINDPWPIPQND